LPITFFGFFFNVAGENPILKSPLSMLFPAGLLVVCAKIERKFAVGATADKTAHKIIETTVRLITPVFLEFVKLTGFIYFLRVFLFNASLFSVNYPVIYIFHILLLLIFFFATMAEAGFIKPPASLIKTAD